MSGTQCKRRADFSLVVPRKQPVRGRFRAACAGAMSRGKNSGPNWSGVRVRVATPHRLRSRARITQSAFERRHFVFVTFHPLLITTNRGYQAPFCSKNYFWQGQEHYF